MREVLNIYKPVGLTPLEVVGKIKEKNSDYKNIPITYAGRLDPMAEGVLVLLAGETTLQKSKYLKLDKKYESDILLGVKTDTFDILGHASFCEKNIEINEESVEKYKGDFVFSLPPYSSFKIKGKPLFWWEREGRIGEVEVPQRKSKIYDIKLLDSYQIGSGELLDVVVNKINLVTGDFRQKNIKRRWRELLSEEKVFDVVKIGIFCSSGMYIRSLSDKMGGTVLHLKRTSVGNFNSKDSVEIK